MIDALDAIMLVMTEAFDSRYGEAWTRRQVADSLTFANTRFVLAGVDADGGIDPQHLSGFALTRQAADEEEVLLIAVRPAFRERGVGKRLMAEVTQAALARGVTRLFLEMRQDNPAEHLYRACGFAEIGRRKGYYRGAVGGPLDAITFGKTIG
ncbi:MAG: GNAT family N-acetyltransferase [Erythrobacter sp.]|nr:GNAT family N-acetyltransferase [Erythrobacter sp.]